MIEEDALSIAYVEHPVSKAEKKEYRKKGFDRIVDARYAPAEMPKGSKLFMKKKAKADQEPKADK